MNLCYQESFGNPLATIAVTEMELAEAFLEQQNEGPHPVPEAPDPADDAIEEGVVAGRPAPSIHDKPKGKRKEDEKAKGKGKGKRAGSRPRSGTPVPTGPVTRSAKIMPTNRYPVAVEGAHMALQSKHYSVVVDVLRAVQYGAVFSPAVTKTGCGCRKHANGVFTFRRPATQKAATQGGGPESRNFRLQSEHSLRDFLQQRAV